jgi:hypothetical protein
VAKVQDGVQIASATEMGNPDLKAVGKLGLVDKLAGAIAIKRYKRNIFE